MGSTAPGTRVWRDQQRPYSSQDPFCGQMRSSSLSCIHVHLLAERRTTTSTTSGSSLGSSVQYGWFCNMLQCVSGASDMQPTKWKIPFVVGGSCGSHREQRWSDQKVDAMWLGTWMHFCARPDVRFHATPLVAGVMSAGARLHHSTQEGAHPPLPHPLLATSMWDDMSWGRRHIHVGV